MGLPAGVDVRTVAGYCCEGSPVFRERGRAVAVPAPPRRGQEILLVTLTKDGRLADRNQLERVARAGGSATDCFFFCHGWLHDEAEAHQESARFFALLDGVLGPLREPLVPLRVGLHWPSKPFSDDTRARTVSSTGLWPEVERRLVNGSHRRGHHSDTGILRDLCLAEGSEELRGGGGAGTHSPPRWSDPVASAEPRRSRRSTRSASG
jgi:hypothetical protein